MEKTANYDLPQWEATDPLRREDFNQAFAALDGLAGMAYTTENKPITYARFSLYSATDGDTVYTFPKAPVCILLSGRYIPTVIAQNYTGTVANSASTDSTRSATFQLSGTQLILQARGTSYSDTALQMIIVY